MLEHINAGSSIFLNHSAVFGVIAKKTWFSERIMISPLLTLILLLQGTALAPAPPAPAPLRLANAVKDFPRSQLRLSNSGPISLDLNQSARTSYETLAELAGLDIVFDRDFKDSFFTPFHVDKAGVLETFDRLSLLTGSFVEVLDSNTVLVASNNQTKRREYEPQVVKTIYLTTSEDATGFVTALRTLNTRLLASGADMKAVVVKDTPDRVAAAEKLGGELYKASSSDPVAIDSAGNLLVPDGQGVRKREISQKRLQVGLAGPISINLNEDARTTYEALAARAGVNIIFDRDFQSFGPMPLKLENTDILDALDILSRQTGTVWFPLDGTTILVSPDNQTRRRDYAETAVKTIYFDNISRPQQLVEVITALRTVLNMRYLAPVPTANALNMRDTADQVALAEKIIADLAKANPALAPTSTGAVIGVGTESGFLKSRAVRTLSTAQSHLDPRLMQTVSLDANGTVRQAFEDLAGKAGFHVTLDRRFQNGALGRFTLKDVRLLDALDFLSLETRTFWNVLDSATLIVAPDTIPVRQELQPPVEKVNPLMNIQTPVGIQEIVVALRTLLNVREVAGSSKGIVLHDTPDNAALAEKLVGELDRLPSQR